MIGLTLGRYFLVRYLKMTAYLLLGVFTLSLILDFTELSSRTSMLPQYTVLGALTLSAMRVPFILQQTVPFIALFGAMSTLIFLNRKYELVVARSAGISAWQFLTPILFGALLFGVAAVLILNPLAAWGYSTAESVEGSWQAGHKTNVQRDRIPWIKQVTDAGETIIGAKTFDQRGTRLIDATFVRFDANHDIKERIDADTAVLKDGYWLLSGATRYVRGEQPEKLGETRIKTLLKPEFVEEKLARAESIPFFELRRKIAAARSFGHSANDFAMQYNWLLAMPALLMAMVLIAATVSLKFTRFGQSGAMILGGIAAGFVLYVVSVVVQAFGRAGFVPTFVAAWFPVLIAVFFGVSFLLHREDG